MEEQNLSLIQRMNTKKESLLLRAKILKSIRAFFDAQHFIEVDTPTLVFSPGMEPHIRPVQINSNKGIFLATSPEFAMKKVLAAGFSRIYQVCKAYRHEAVSTTHQPEFTMLEWYRAPGDYIQIMDDVENLFQWIANDINFKNWESKAWPRIRIEECFRTFAGLEFAAILDIKHFLSVCKDRGYLSGKTDVNQPGLWDDLFFLILLNEIEPQLKKCKTPVIVYDYPLSQSALSNVYEDSRGLKWAKRFEVYAEGLELGNAFDELVNPEIQRKRFQKDQALRRAIYEGAYPESPIDEELLSVLPYIDSAGGIAMGVDRIVMCFAQKTRIEDVLWQTSYWD